MQRDEAVLHRNVSTSTTGHGRLQAARNIQPSSWVDAAPLELAEQQHQHGRAALGGGALKVLHLWRRKAVTSVSVAAHRRWQLRTRIVRVQQAIDVALRFVSTVRVRARVTSHGRTCSLLASERTALIAASSLRTATRTPRSGSGSDDTVSPPGRQLLLPSFSRLGCL